MKDSFTLDEFIFYSTGFGSKSESGMVEERRKYSTDDLAVPDKRIVSNIMNYSKALSVIKTKASGNFNLLLN